ncbi:MAG: hypothetical protein O3B04_04870 [Chloroflexi bacterium]|nr:hypothetical protein [Chloroflexota bacterium]MDA1297321.1 hypothetical protein [Chloroflexota bacterium]
MANDGTDGKNEILTTFINLLFAAAMSIGLSSVVNGGVWLKPSADSSFQHRYLLEILVASYTGTLIILSWIGYNISVK